MLPILKYQIILSIFLIIVNSQVSRIEKKHVETFNFLHNHSELK